MNQEGNCEPVSKQNLGPEVDPNIQVAAAIQHMTDLLAYVIEHQGQNPVHQPGNLGNHVKGEDRALERFNQTQTWLRCDSPTSP